MLVNVNLKDKETISYILGVLIGDGYLSYYKKKSNYIIGLNTVDYPFAYSFRQALKKIGLHPYLTKEHPQRWSKDGYNRQDRYKVAGASIKFYKFCKEIINDNILKYVGNNKKYIFAFLRGFYESEGYLRERYVNATELGMSNTDIHNVHVIKKLLDKVGIKVSITKDFQERYTTGVKYNISVLGKTKDRFNFLKMINPSIKYKGRTKSVKKLNDWQQLKYQEQLKVDKLNKLLKKI